jgi:GWxTD domain-containing protein
MDRTSKTRFQTNLAPGEYTACLELYDVESKAFLRRKDPFRIRKSDLSRLSVGPLFFFRRSGEFDPLAEFPFPEFPPVRSMDDSAFSALGFLLLDRPSSEAVVQAKLCRGTDAPVLADSFRVPLIRPIQPFAIPIPPSLDFGTYELTVRAEVPGDTAQARTVLFVQWGSHPSERADPRFTVEPLAYIMDRREFKRLQALDPDDQRKAVDAYWESKNPDRSAFINPLEREFYQRVRFANRYFSMFKGGLEGWRLDRGRIYILYGPPESVERPAGSMVEAWFYPDIPKRFLFVDRYGTGRFDLVREIDE